jgi:hypothetical protein
MTLAELDIHQIARCMGYTVLHPRVYDPTHTEGILVTDAYNEEIMHCQLGKKNCVMDGVAKIATVVLPFALCMNTSTTSRIMLSHRFSTESILCRYYASNGRVVDTSVVPCALLGDRLFPNYRLPSRWSFLTFTYFIYRRHLPHSLRTKGTWEQSPSTLGFRTESKMMFEQVEYPDDVSPFKD